MNAHTAFPAISPARADELRILTLHTERAIKALQDHVWHYQRDPNYAELALCDALSFVLPDVDFSDAMDAAQEALWITDEGFPLTADGDVKPGADRVWVPLKALGK